MQLWIFLLIFSRARSSLVHLWLTSLRRVFLFSLFPTVLRWSIFVSGELYHFIAIIFIILSQHKFLHKHPASWDVLVIDVLKNVEVFVFLSPLTKPSNLHLTLNDIQIHDFNQLNPIPSIPITKAFPCHPAASFRGKCTFNAFLNIIFRGFARQEQSYLIIFEEGPPRLTPSRFMRVHRTVQRKR